MKKSIDKLRFYEYNSTCIDEAWLSLVERCVRDAEVVGSNPVASTTHRKSETNWFSGFLFAILVVMQQQKGKEKLTDQERFMKEAIRQAKKAEALEEVPIGCVIVHEGKIIARGYNRRNTDKNTLSHAELNAIRFGIHTADHYFIYSRLDKCPGAHLAWFQRHIHSASLQPPVSKFFTGFADCIQFCDESFAGGWI